MTAPTLMREPDPTGTALIEAVDDSTRASMLALETADTLRAPAASTWVPVMYALTLDGFSVPNPVPNASSALNNAFCPSQPMVLKARVMPIEVPLEVVSAL